MVNLKPKDLADLSGKLKKAGYKIRRHCCDYYVGDEKKFICAFAIFPRWNEIRVYNLTDGELPGDISEIFEEFATRHSMKVVVKNMKSNVKVLRC